MDSKTARLIGYYMEYTFNDKLIFTVSEDTLMTMMKELNDSLFEDDPLSVSQVKQAWKEAIDIILYGLDMFHGSIFDIDTPACRYVYIDLYECAENKLYQAIDTLEIK